MGSCTTAIPRFLALIAVCGLATSAHAQPAPAPQPATTAPPSPILAPAAEPEDPVERDTPVEPLPPKPPPPPGYVPPDPATWWKAEERVPVRIDPLGDRRARKNDPKVTVTNDTPPLLYRLWGLPPLQTMVLRPGEVVIEVWVRPSGAPQEAIARVTVRQDGNVFLQARAGVGCCRPEIGRRVDIDQKLDGDGAVFKTLAKSALWNQPVNVTVDVPGVAQAVCVKGAGYDLTLRDYQHSVHLRRYCDQEAVGSVAPVLQAVLGAAIGKDPRFDVLVRKGADFSLEQSIYNDMVAQGGKLTPKSFKP